MKIIRTIFFTFLALGMVGLAAFFILFQTFDAERFLPQISQKASAFLGRPVTMAGASLGLSLKGISLDVGPLTVADDPAFTKQPWIKVDKVRIYPDLRSWVFGRRLKLITVILQGPQVHFIRTQEGDFNIKSGHNSVPPDITLIPKPSSASVPLTAPVPAGPVPPPKPTPISFEIGSLNIQDGAISYIDQNTAFPIDIWLTGINGQVKEPGLSKPLEFSCPALVYAEGPYAVGPKALAKVRLNLSLTDLSKPEAFQARAGIHISDGVINDFNLVNALLSPLLGSFGLSGENMGRIFGGQLKDKLGEKDTTIQEADLQGAFHDKTLYLDDLSIKTNMLELTAKGTVDEQMNADLQTLLHLDRGLSSAFVDEFKGFKGLMDDSRRISVPASLKGKLPHLKYKPDKEFRKKSRRALMSEGANILGALLGAR